MCMCMCVCVCVCMCVCVCVNREGVTEQEGDAVSQCQLSSGDSSGVLEHHPSLGTFTLSIVAGIVARVGELSLQEDIQQLCHLIQHHTQLSKVGKSLSLSHLLSLSLSL